MIQNFLIPTSQFHFFFFILSLILILPWINGNTITVLNPKNEYLYRVNLIYGNVRNMMKITFFY